MLEIPKADKVQYIERNNVVTKYVLEETRYCNRCEKQATCVLTELNRKVDWLVLSCWECESVTKTVYERDTMPRCEECDEHFKMNSHDVPLEIYDKLGKRICPNCSIDYLRELRKTKA